MSSLIPNFDQEPWLVAELSGNHGGSLQKALELVDAAYESGANAIKLQTYKPETITVEARNQNFLIDSGLWKGNFLFDLYKKAMTPWEWHTEINQRAVDKNLICFSSPFDETAVDFLEKEISPPIYKIASFELNHYPLLKKVGSLGKKVLASTGVSQSEEIEEAISILKGNGCPEVILMHCVSSYPAEPDEFFLSKIPQMQKDFNCKIGLSDHSKGHFIPVLATGLGVKVIEKHLTLDRKDESIDGAFSLLPEDFKQMCTNVKKAYDSMGFGRSRNIETTENVKFKRSILVSKKIESGQVLNNDNIRIARPNHGMCPSKWEHILGKKVNRRLEVGDPIRIQDIAD